MSSPQLQDKLDEVRKQLALLDHALEQRLPDHATQLAKINAMLRSQPELGAIMLDEDIHILMKSVIADHGVQFSIGSKGKGATKKLTNADLDNIEL